jgi:CNT family concentrative nucleoside transporter
MGRFTGILGLALILAAAWLFSTDRRAIRWRTVAIGVGLQVLFAIFVIRVPLGQWAIAGAGEGARRLLACSFAGSRFVFGEAGAQNSSFGFIFAFQVLPAIIFIAAFFSILYYFGIMQLLIRAAAWVMERAMGASGAESLNVAASIVMGQTEAPLTIRPYLPRLTQSELMVVMTAGMAHVSGSMMAAYIATGVAPAHLLAAVIMTAPGTITVAKMLVPETGRPETAEGATLPAEERASNVLEAAARGTSDGLMLALNVAAMLISFLAIIYLINSILGGAHGFFAAHGFRWFPSGLEQIFGAVFAPVAFIIGISWHDCLAVGNLLGTRMVLNELVAFNMLGSQRVALDPRSFTIATFALCGFANFSSIGIQIGGLGVLAPLRRGDLARLGFKAMLAGTMANLMSACIVGVLL